MGKFQWQTQTSEISLQSFILATDEGSSSQASKVDKSKGKSSVTPLKT